MKKWGGDCGVIEKEFMEENGNTISNFERIIKEIVILDWEKPRKELTEV